MAKFNPYESYLNTDAQTTDQLRLIVLMYDATIRYLREARGAVERNDRLSSAKALEKARATVSELRATLDLKQGGEIAFNLVKLYNYVSTEILLANVESDIQRVDNVIKILSNLREGWVELSKNPDAKQHPANMKV
ncbi:MAG: flagellar export chaperone FliS [bacterium]|nr:flagellar export chaperone FliS [bacterium]